MRILIRWAVVAVALVVAAWIVPGIEVSGDNGWLAVLITAAILGLINAFVRPFLQFISCGCIVLTLGFFLLFINAFTLWFSSWLAQNVFNVQFVVDGFWPAFWGGIIVSIVSFLASLLLPDEVKSTV